VYNRPDEIDELLLSLTKQNYKEDYEVVIVEDGSIEKCDKIIKKYVDLLKINYLAKTNTGAGLSRNFGMQNAIGNYFIILDSDVIVPPSYLQIVYNQLQKYYTDAFGGPDSAHESFTFLQKAINYSMTSMLTTGGLRGNKKSKSKFQPRSFNMGISKKAFLETQGFSKRKIGEDIDLSFRLWKQGFETQLIPDAFVYHKRRNTIKSFFIQTYRFGKERPVLNKEYPGTAKLTYWFPSVFVLGVIFSFVALFFYCFLPFIALKLYLLAILIDSSTKNKSFIIGLLSVFTSIIQFFGYGLGFLGKIMKG